MRYMKSLSMVILASWLPAISTECLHLDPSYSLPLEYNHSDSLGSEFRHLCVTFLSTPSDEKKANITKETLLINTKRLDCDWVILFYSITSETMRQELCNGARASTLQQFHMDRVLCCDEASYTRDPTAYISAHIQNRTQLEMLGYNLSAQQRVVKPIMYVDILYYLIHMHSYRRVLLMDSDIDFQHFDFNRGMLLWTTASTPSPLLVQPVMDGSSKIWTSRWRYWRDRNKVDTPSYLYPFVEQGSPFFDASFFKWFVLTVIRGNTLPYHMYTQSDFGYDGIWCNAAYYFGTNYLGYGNHFTSCAVLIASGPSVHRDTRTLGKNDLFRGMSGIVVDYYRKCYAAWYRPF